MKTYTGTRTIVAVLLISAMAAANADSITYSDPATFVGGAPLTASSLNSKFNETKRAVDDNDVRINTILSNGTVGGGDITSVTAGTGLINSDATGGQIGDIVLELDTAAVQSAIGNTIGAKDNANPLNHDRFNATEAQTAMGTTLSTNPLNHDRYSDANARTALQTQLSAKQDRVSGRCDSVSQKMVGVFASGAVDCVSEDKNSLDASGGVITNRLFIDSAGEVGIRTTAPTSLLHLNTDGSRWNTRINEGDFKIGNATHRFKIGVAIDGAGAGDVRLSSQGGTNRLILGAGTDDTLSVGLDGVMIDPSAGFRPNSLVTDRPALYVIGNKNQVATMNGHVMLVENIAGGSADVMALVLDLPTAPGGSNNFLTFINNASGVQSQIGAIEGNAATGGVTFKTSGGDYAEWLQKVDHNEKIKPGDIVGMFGGRVSKNTEQIERVMVASNTAIVAGAYPGKNKEKDYVLTAFIGQVDVRVRGKVKIGDYIIASGQHDGVGIAVSPQQVSPSQFNLAVGRAWKASNVVAEKRIKISTGILNRVPFADKMYKTMQSQASVIKSQSVEIQKMKQQLAEFSDFSQQMQQIKTQLRDVQQERLIQASITE